MAGISGASREQLALLIGRGRSVITVEDVASELNVSRRDSAVKVARWAAQGWLRRVKRDLYIPVPIDAIDPTTWTADPLFLADAVWHPCYVTGWTAANLWGLTEQTFRTTIIKSTQPIRRTSNRILEYDYLVFPTTSANLNWGMRSQWQGGRRILVADPARTVIDMMIRPELGGGIRMAAEILAAYLEEGSERLLIDYAVKLDSGVGFKRLGYLAEAIAGHQWLVDACHDRRTEGFPLLDPSQSATGPRSSRWKLRMNVQLSTLEQS